MKKTLLLSAFLACAFMAQGAHATNMDWTDGRCVIVDGSFKACKPSDKWDTQKTGEDRRPVKWELHKRDVNPVIQVYYDWDASGKTAHDYAKVIKSKLKSKGITITSSKDTVINGRNVTIVRAHNAEHEQKWIMGIWRNAAKGFQLRCSANEGDFADYEDTFMRAIKQVQIVSEHR